MTFRVLLLLGWSIFQIGLLPGAAQERSGESEPDESPTESEQSPPPDTATTRSTERERPNPPEWRFDALLSGVYDSNLRNRVEGEESFGVNLEGGIRFENRRSYPTIILDYELTGHIYTNVETWDRLSHRFLASYINHFQDNRWRWEGVWIRTSPYVSYRYLALKG